MDQDPSEKGLQVSSDIYVACTRPPSGLTVGRRIVVENGEKRHSYSPRNMDKIGKPTESRDLWTRTHWKRTAGVVGHQG